ncbi:2Fe-2S iron-sulfur cluster-binding protein [Halopiger xanaduensis]|uniref:Ferredoxin n=1 Tax=Halopiger xanaduensis (strain DSM 18323 / JCM 14033 / SH-6) TaxID=797210 RepID=F8D3J5_HALXS|nr:2Fe-2S iron-sulfur cluster-binding protein [Halopiger xanaduensis]AEH36229.1 ferredoxin [Halopiger xanaduensis SH-6]
MASHEVVLEWPEADRERRTIAVRADETVLEGAERADVALPFGCRTGACGTCTGRLLSVGGTDATGTNSEPTTVDEAFDYRRPPRALKDRHRAAGYVLLCIAAPRADCRLAVGSSVHAELVENPWK